MDKNSVHQQLTHLVDLANRAEASAETETGTIPRHRVNAELFIELRSGGLALLHKNFGIDHPFYVEFERVVRVASPKDVALARGILKAVRKEIDIDYH